MKLFVSLLTILTIGSSLHAETAAKLSREITAESVVALMNDFRDQNHLPPLHSEERMMRAAADRMRDMEDLGYWSHESPEGRSPFFWLRYRSYRFSWAGENLARGFETAELLVSSWMDSPGHRSNILGAEYREVGVALIEGATTSRYPGKSVVVLFGRE